MNRNFLFFLLLSLLTSCAKTTESSPDTAEFILKDDLQIELIAAEPLLEAPVAMTFDRKGRIWAVELTGYMRNIEGSEEELPDGKIVILEDQDGDGQMDTRTVFLDQLVLPRALAIVNDGLLYAEPPNLWWVSIAGDQPGEKILVDSFYAPAGNVEHQANGLHYNLDNWIYSAKSNTRYRFKDGQWLKEATAQRGQWGITNDDLGRLYYNDNSNPLTGDYLLPNALTDHPHLPVKYGMRQQIATDRRVFPYQPTAVNRGYMDEVLDAEGKLQHFTSSCGPLIYRGTALPEAFYGNAFVCGPEANLIKRYLIREEQGRTHAEPAYEADEFLLSKDETFRPVNLYNGPDGALYVVDMRRGVIQHRAFMTTYLYEKILAKGLDTIINKGRIYRIAAQDSPAASLPDLSALTTTAWVPHLQHEQAWMRQMAQQFLVEQQDERTIVSIKELAVDQTSPMGQIHALWTLEGLDALTLELLVDASATTDPLVMATVVRLSEGFLVDELETDLQQIFQRAKQLKDAVVNLQLAHTVGKCSHPAGEAHWLALAEAYADDPLYAEALISGTAGRTTALLALHHPKDKPDSLTAMLQAVVANKRNNKVFSPKMSTEDDMDQRTQGFYLYQSYCAGCHGQDGQGIENLAPPLYHSEYVSGAAEPLVLLVLHGLKGPITVQGVKYDMNLVMPGLKNNPALDDEKISAILTYIRNGFSNENQMWISPEEVRRLRAATSDREAPFTAEELDNWMQDQLQ